MMKNKLILFLIDILLFCFIFTFVSAEESIEFDYPKEVITGNEFEVDLELNGFEDDSYDVKIDFMKDGKRVSRIWNGNSWQSTFKYLPEAIETSSSNKETFRINISEEVSGEINIEVKIRNSKEKSLTFSDYSIEIVNNENSDRVTKKEIDEKSEVVIEEEILNDKSSIKLSNNLKKDNQSESIKRYGYVIYESKGEKIKKYTVYFFALQCVILAILVGFKKIS